MKNNTIKANVIVLPVDKARKGQICKGGINQELFIMNDEHQANYNIMEFFREKDIPEKWQPMELYLVFSYDQNNSLTHIKEGNWYYNSDKKEIQKCNSYAEYEAITNGNHYWKNQIWFAIAATTDSSLNLPLIPDEFIQEYCKSNGSIKEILLSLEDKGHKDWGGDDVNGEPFWIENIQIETTKDNHVILHPVVERMFTLEEVKQIASKALYAGYANGTLSARRFANFHDDWIKENF